MVGLFRSDGKEVVVKRVTFVSVGLDSLQDSNGCVLLSNESGDLLDREQVLLEVNNDELTLTVEEIASKIEKEVKGVQYFYDVGCGGETWTLVNIKNPCGRRKAGYDNYTLMELVIELIGSKVPLNCKVSYDIIFDSIVLEIEQDGRRFKKAFRPTARCSVNSELLSLMDIVQSNIRIEKLKTSGLADSEIKFISDRAYKAVLKGGFE